MTNRRAEAEDVRAWDKGVAERNELDENRAWVVWGVGATDERAADPDRAAELPGEPGNDIATEIARERDPDWNADDDASWVRVVEADEDEVDALMVEDETVRGYAPYLIAPENTGEDLTRMRGVLRGDSVRRRKPGRMDAGRTS
jgi:hypothetical protein